MPWQSISARSDWASQCGNGTPPASVTPIFPRAATYSGSMAWWWVSMKPSVRSLIVPSPLASIVQVMAIPLGRIVVTILTAPTIALPPFAAAGHLRPLPQADGGARREPVDGQFAAAQPDLQRVGDQPDGIVRAVAVTEEVDALVGRADPAAARLGLLAQVRAIDQEVRPGQQLGDCGVRHRAGLFEGEPAVDHHTQPALAHG